MALLSFPSGMYRFYNADTYNEMNPSSGDLQFLAASNKAVYSAMTAQDPSATFVMQGKGRGLSFKRGWGLVGHKLTQRLQCFSLGHAFPCSLCPLADNEWMEAGPLFATRLFSAWLFHSGFWTPDRVQAYLSGVPSGDAMVCDGRQSIHAHRYIPWCVRDKH
jgi:hypothetical protein